MYYEFLVHFLTFLQYGSSIPLFGRLILKPIHLSLNRIAKKIFNPYYPEHTYNPELQVIVPGQVEVVTEVTLTAQEITHLINNPNIPPLTYLNNLENIIPAEAIELVPVRAGPLRPFVIPDLNEIVAHLHPNESMTFRFRQRLETLVDLNALPVSALRDSLNGLTFLKILTYKASKLVVTTASTLIGARLIGGADNIVDPVLHQHRIFINEFEHSDMLVLANEITVQCSELGNTLRFIF